MSNEITLGISVLVLLCMSGLFSASETALTSASMIRLRSMFKAGKKGAQRALGLQDIKEKTVSSILIGNNLVNIAATALSTSLMVNIFGEAGLAYATIMMTIIVVVFSEVVPKTYAVQNAETVFLKVSGFLRALVLILSPAVWMLEKVVSLFGIDMNAKAEPLTEEELRGTIDLHQDGERVDEEQKMLHGVLDLEERPLKAIMTQSFEVDVININADPTEIQTLMAEKPHTRFPVVEMHGTVTKVRGIFHTRDCAHIMGKIGIEDVKTHMADPYFVESSMTAFDLIQAFRNRREHFAVVNNEFGNFAGIITLENLFEEIVGDISEGEGIEGVTIKDKDFLTCEPVVYVRHLLREPEIDFDVEFSDHETMAEFYYRVRDGKEKVSLGDWTMSPSQWDGAQITLFDLVKS